MIDSAWSAALRNVLLPSGDRLFGQQMMRRLAFLEKAQWWTREQIQQHRDRLLQQLVRTAVTEVPFYRQLFERAGVNYGDVSSPADLQRLPVVTKDMLRTAYPSGVTRPTGFRTHEASSSGSTGENFRVLSDSQTAGWYRATLLLTLQWAGWRIGEPHMQTGMAVRRTADRRLKDRILRCHYISAADLSDYALNNALDVLESKDILHLWGYPGSLYCLARAALERGWTRPLRSVVTWGDNLYPRYRATMEKAFGTVVTDTYGCGEGMHIAAQCGSGTHYHLHELDVVVEFLDDEGAPVRPGEPGNIVVTRLHPGPMPLIRYRVGDIGVPMSGSCPCGRGTALMSSIQGRDTDIVITPDGNRLIVHFFTGILEYFHDIAQFQIIQDDLHGIRLLVVPGDGYSDDTARRAVDILKARGAGQLDIHVEVVPEIPTSPSGKRRFVISNYAKATIANRVTIP